MSAEDTVNDIVDRALEMGEEAADRATSYGQQAISASSGFASMPWAPISFTPANIEPPVTIPQNVSGVDGALFDATYDRILGDLSAQFAAFFSTYFPNECDSMGAAQEWMCKALTQGGTGIKPHVEDQIWQRERSRVLRDAERVEGEVIATHAARGFPLPAGAATHQIMLIRQGAHEQIAEASRTRAVQQAQMEVENIRFSVQQAINYRTQAIAAAADYIRTLALGPEVAARLATSAADAQARLISAANTYYGSRIRVEELKLDVLKFNKSEQQDTARVDVQEFSRRLQARAETLSAAARAQGDMAAAAYNSVHGAAQVAVQGIVT